MIALLRTTEDMDDWEYDIEEVLGEDGSTVGSLVVRFALPQDVTSAAGLELLCEPEEALSGSAAAAGLAASPASGYALVIKSADRQGERLDSLPPYREDKTSIVSRAAIALTCCVGCIRYVGRRMPRGVAVRG